jgi:alkylresorcinol/alkylpyrone synthase
LRIVSAASAFPKNYYPQPVLVDAFRKHWGNKLERPEMFGWLHERVGVDGRYLAYPVETYENLRDFGHANDLWIAAALEPAQQAICRALGRAGIAREDLVWERRTAPGTWSVLAAMGPGFCSELVLLRW